MALNKKIIYLYILCLVLVLLLTYFYNKNTEKFENSDLYYGILPKEEHPIRVKNILYYNDPIFIEFGSKFLLLNIKNGVGDSRESLKYIAYIEPKKAKKGLSPIEYNVPVLLKVYPNNEFNKVFDVEFTIMPYTRPTNNQQPYVQINDFVTFKTLNNEYLSVRNVSNTIELINSQTVPENSIFRLKNSPQCFTNYKKYGFDTRKTSVTTMKMVLEEMKKIFEQEKYKLKQEEENYRNLKKEETSLKENIQTLQNTEGNIIATISSLGEEYENNIKKLKNDIDFKKLAIDRELEQKKQLAENVIDEQYLKQMREIISKNC